MQQELLEINAPGTSLEISLEEDGESKSRIRTVIWSGRFAIIAFFICGWQFTPLIPGISQRFHFENRFFISSPVQIVHMLWIVLVAGPSDQLIWAPFARTMITALIGTLAASAVGAVAGVILSHWRTLNIIVRPYITFFNAIPRIAIIPIIVLVFGTSDVADAVTASMIVFFLVFYTAFEASSSISTELLDNARLLGASSWRIVWRVRWPYAFGWTIGAFPNAIAFGIVGSVTAEILTGSSGIGAELNIALANENATLTFAVVIILAFTGVALVGGARWLRSYLLPWWETGIEQ